MSWTIDRHGRTAVVTMTMNPVNAQNRAFFDDLHDTFDRLETDHPESTVVLTGQRGRFSAGLDLGEHFPLFAGPPDGVADWFGPALRDIAELSDQLDQELPTWFTTPKARHTHRRYWKQLKNTEPPW